MTAAQSRNKVGMAVGSTWFLQAVTGRFRWSIGWMDLAGWALGASWIILALGSTVFTFYMMRPAD